MLHAGSCACSEEKSDRHCNKGTCASKNDTPNGEPSTSRQMKQRRRLDTLCLSRSNIAQHYCKIAFSRRSEFVTNETKQPLEEEEDAQKLGMVQAQLNKDANWGAKNFKERLHSVQPRPPSFTPIVAAFSDMTSKSTHGPPETPE